MNYLDLADAPHDDALTRRIIGMAIRVHRHFGPGLLESAYEACLCHELIHEGLAIVRQVVVPLMYQGVQLETGFRADIIVEQAVILEIKAVENIIPLHESQMLTYLRLTGCRVGLLLNFNSIMLKDGLRRFVL
jgi:GxxExxY protein